MDAGIPLPVDVSLQSWPAVIFAVMFVPKSAPPGTGHQTFEPSCQSGSIHPGENHICHFPSPPCHCFLFQWVTWALQGSTWGWLDHIILSLSTHLSYQHLPCSTAVTS